jgi:hypothetical protein
MMASAITLAKSIAAAGAMAVLSACSTMTSLDGATPGTKLAIKGVGRTELPRSEDLKSKATGQYEFMATGPDGKKVYGLLPLKVNGGTMAASILLFAPALFIGGFRDTFPYYQVDTEQNVLRYKVKETDEWRVYRPVDVEINRAKAHFGMYN